MNTVHKISLLQNTSTSNPSIINIIDEHSNSVYKFCRSITFSKEDAEDLFQETFLHAFENQEKLKNWNNPKNFLFSTSLYLWKSWKRKNARRSRIAPIGKLNDNIDSNINLEQMYIVEEENKTIRMLVENLEDKYRIPIILYYTLEMKTKDIAKILKLPTGTIKSRLFKARKLIEKGFGEINNEK